MALSALLSSTKLMVAFSSSRPTICRQRGRQGQRQKGVTTQLQSMQAGRQAGRQAGIQQQQADNLAEMQAGR
jgi:hypothetical protein